MDFIDWIVPYCKVCASRGLPHNHCSLCNESIWLNCLEQLKDNHKKYGIEEFKIKIAKYICSNCCTKNMYEKCDITGKPFYLFVDNKADIWNSSKKPEKISPYNKYGIYFNNVSPEGLIILNKAYIEYEDNFKNFIAGTKGEYVKGYNIKTVICRIEVNQDCNNVGEIEDFLKKYCAQIGANGYVKFFWDKKIRYHEEEYVAGYGANGNPYYRTRRWTTAYFVGHADAVVLSRNS